MPTLDQTPEAQRVYDAFLVSFPNLPVHGLFENAGRFAIVAGGIEESLVPALRRFISTFAPAHLWIEVVSSVPQEYSEVAPRTGVEFRSAKGSYVTMSEWDRALSLHLSSDFPYVGCEKGTGGVALVIRVSRALTPREDAKLAVLLDELGFTASTGIKVMQPGEVLSHYHRNDRDGLVLKPCRWFDALPNVLVSRLERDEDLWRNQSRSAGRREFMGPPWQESPGSSCLVQTTFPPENIRAYLSLYSHVIVEAPIEGRVQETLDCFGVDRRSFKELVATGSVRLIVPRSIDRYDTGWLAELCEAAPNGVLFSRELAAYAQQDQARRNPLLLTPAKADDRRLVLRALDKVAAMDRFRAADVKPILTALRSALSEHWAWAEYMDFARGAMSSLTGVLATHSIHLMQELHGKDYTIELGSVAERVEWAGALGAHLVPFEHAEYSEVGAANFVVALASGVRADSVPVASPQAFSVASELLAFANDTDAVEFAKELGNGDLYRFRGLVASIVKPGRSAEEIEEIVRAWNAQVRHYNRSPDRVRSFGIGGIVLSAIALGKALPGADQVVPFVTPFLPLITTKLVEDLAPRYASVGHALDEANATLARAAPPAVLLARMRKRILGMK
ncbi:MULTISPECIES: hypothetical protein [Sorangium]|uniref:hypothetical protein n=1 Tax=Sorangium TaxID=39643 RepID=UPI003D9C09D5